MDLPQTEPWSPEEFETRLRALGRRYHVHHPFHVMMNEGQLSREQIRGWVANRFYYQIHIPLKDAALIANCPDRAIRQRWLHRIRDHDGDQPSDGGIEAWLRLAEACGLERDEVLSEVRVLPGVRFAVDAYVNFVRQVPWQEGVCASLTELFAPTAHRQRLAGWPQHYPWIDPTELQYFRNRLLAAPQDVAYGLQLTLQYFDTRQRQDRALQILQFKLDILWTMLDAMYLAYVAHMPPYHNVGET